MSGQDTPQQTIWFERATRGSPYGVQRFAVMRAVGLLVAAHMLPVMCRSMLELTGSRARALSLPCGCIVARPAVLLGEL